MSDRIEGDQPEPRARNARRLCVGWATLALVLTAVALIRGEGTFGSWAYPGLAVLTSAAIVLGATVHRSPARRAWLLVAAGQLAFAVGDAGWTYYARTLGQVPFPSAADAGYLAGYGLLLFGVAALSRARWVGRDGTTLIDTGIVTVVGAAAVWIFVAGPSATGAGASAVERAVSTAYPVGDIALLAIIARLLFSPGRRPTSLWLVGGTLVLLLLADLVYGAQLLQTGAHGHGWSVYVTDGFWLASYGLLGAAALHPSMRSLTTPAEPAARPAYARVLVLGAALAALPAVQALGDHDPGRHSGVLFAAILLAIGLTVVRMAKVVRAEGQRADRLSAQEAALRRALGERDAVAAELTYQAFHDPLTGLANRARFVDRLEIALAASAGGGTTLAVLFGDLDGFKEVNDTLGHGTGDELLEVVADRVSSSVRPSDTVARFGGDEFAVLLPGVEEHEARRVAERIVSTVSDPLILACGPVQVGISIGIALSSRGDPGGEEVLRRADVAMYMAKGSLTHRVVTYEEAEQGKAGKLVSASALANALPNGELRAHYHPIVDLASGRIEGLEALVRWEHPEHGLLGPGSFLEMAQALGFLADMDLHVLDVAVAQLGRWQREFRDPALFVSVNLSSPALLDHRLLPLLRKALAASGVPAHSLVVEITEEILAADPGDVVARVRALRSVGVRVALDDFGTGYSSLSRLMNLPVDVLKIDRSFAQALPRTPGERNLASYVLELGRICDLLTIVEGVEDRSQAEAVREYGCTLVQGFVFSEPLPATRVAALLSSAAPAIAVA